MNKSSSNSNSNSRQSNSSKINFTKTKVSEIVASALAEAQKLADKAAVDQIMVDVNTAITSLSPTNEQFGQAAVAAVSRSSSNVAVADAITAAVTMPCTFSKLAAKNALLVHYFNSSSQESGLQALIVPTMESALGLPKGELPSTILAQHVYIQLAEKGCSFSTFQKASSRGQAIILPLEVYLQLLKFFANDYVLIEKKFKHDIQIMKDKSETIFIENGLGFIGHGYCIYKHYFNNETVLDIRAESQYPQSVLFIHLTYKQNQPPMQLHSKMMISLAANLPSLLSTLSSL